MTGPVPAWKVEQRNACDVPANGERVSLIWTDIPFNTGKVMAGRAGSYKDSNPAEVIIALRVWAEALGADGTMVVCCDYRMVRHVLNGLESLTYKGEVIWEFGLGRPRETWWPVRHNNLMTFAKGNAPFNVGAVPLERRLSAPYGHLGSNKRSGSVWQHTMNNTHRDRVGYPTQKPVEIIEPFVLAHTVPGELVADPFCGSSTTGIASVRNGRSYYGCDLNPNAVAVSRQRLASTLVSGRLKG